MILDVVLYRTYRPIGRNVYWDARNFFRSKNVGVSVNVY
jgi:hypothetical protein